MSEEDWPATDEALARMALAPELVKQQHAWPLHYRYAKARPTAEVLVRYKQITDEFAARGYRGPRQRDHRALLQQLAEVSLHEKEEAERAAGMVDDLWDAGEPVDWDAPPTLVEEKLMKILEEAQRTGVRDAQAMEQLMAKYGLGEKDFRS